MSAGTAKAKWRRLKPHRGDNAGHAVRRCVIHAGTEFAPLIAEILRDKLKQAWTTKRPYYAGGTFPLDVEIRVTPRTQRKA